MMTNPETRTANVLIMVSKYYFPQKSAWLLGRVVESRPRAGSVQGSYETTCHPRDTGITSNHSDTNLKAPTGHR